MVPCSAARSAAGCSPCTASDSRHGASRGRSPGSRHRPVRADQCALGVQDGEPMRRSSAMQTDELQLNNGRSPGCGPTRCHSTAVGASLSTRAARKLRSCALGQRRSAAPLRGVRRFTPSPSANRRRPSALKVHAPHKTVMSRRLVPELLCLPNFFERAPPRRCSSACCWPSRPQAWPASPARHHAELLAAPEVRHTAGVVVDARALVTITSQ